MILSARTSVFETSQQTLLNCSEPAGYSRAEPLIQYFYLIDVGRITGHPGEALLLLVPLWTYVSAQRLGIGYVVKVTKLKKYFAPAAHPDIQESKSPHWPCSLLRKNRLRAPFSVFPGEICIGPTVHCWVRKHHCEICIGPTVCHCVGKHH